MGCFDWFLIIMGRWIYIYGEERLLFSYSLITEQNQGLSHMVWFNFGLSLIGLIYEDLWSWCRCYIDFNRKSASCGLKIHWSWGKSYTMSILHAYLIGLRILIIQSTARCNWCLLSRFADSWVFNWSVVKIQGNIVPIYDSGVLSSWSFVEWSDSTT